MKNTFDCGKIVREIDKVKARIAQLKLAEDLLILADNSEDMVQQNKLFELADYIAFTLVSKNLYGVRQAAQNYNASPICFLDVKEILVEELGGVKEIMLYSANP